jgi:hypothetical protein
MGEVIRRDAAVQDILDDGRTTLRQAVARGGDWQTAAEGRLGSVLALADAVAARKLDAVRALEPAQAALDAGNDEADALVARVSDDVWNLVGRPAHDAALDIVFPGGFTYYTEGDVNEQPDRMELLAGLLESRIHPRLDEAKARAFAAEIRESGTALRGKAEAARPLRTQLSLAARMETAVGRATQVALSGLKRTWKADGKSESEIHSVIPDRPSPGKKPAAPPAG